MLILILLFYLQYYSCTIIASIKLKPAQLFSTARSLGKPCGEIVAWRGVFKYEAPAKFRFKLNTN